MTEGEYESIPFERKFIIDRTIPKIASYEPLDGKHKSQEFKKQFITNREDIFIDILDGPIYADNVKVIHNHYDSYIMDLSHIINNSIYLINPYGQDLILSIFFQSKLLLL